MTDRFLKAIDMVPGFSMQDGSLTLRIGSSLIARAEFAVLDGHIEIAQLHVAKPYRRLGHGARMLERICHVADQHGVPLLLAVMPGPNAVWLEDWYARRGFAPRADLCSGDDQVMLRSPNPACEAEAFALAM